MTSSADAIRAGNAKAVQKAIVLALAVGIVLSLALVIVAFIAGGDREQNGALVGMGLALIVTLPTLVTGMWGVKGNFSALAISVLGTWLVKMGGLIVAVLLLRDAPWLSMPWAGVGLLLGAVVPTLVEAILLLRTRPKLEV